MIFSVALILCAIVLCALVVFLSDNLEHELNLYLDDERDTPKGWYRAYCYEGALNFLRQGHINILSLDHDLGEEKTGYDVACWIEEQAANGLWHLVPNEIRIHSANPVGRKRIQQVIDSIERFRTQK